ncbi:MAG: Nif3-like dinuclear metal center hexameric protein [Halobacteriovoraceae bacterium]|nr:Nif3-like dinuclear metal center hexameric protein [Halobacteriovoraceae bacterium]
MGLKREQLTHFLDELLNSKEFKDYGPNGLQIEGTETIQKIAFAVSATQASIEEAIRKKADTLIVHHGLFWGFHGVRTLTGPFAKRVLPIVKSEINLYGYHLPLDAHPVVGNAASVAKLMGLSIDGPFGDHKGCPTGIRGSFTKPIKAKELQENLGKILNHDVILSSPNPDQVISTMGIITGGANGGWLDAYREGLDSYLTGEISEHDWHDAKEAGVHMFAGGHNATEQFGVQTLMKEVEKKFEIESFFIDSPNPA